MKRMFRPAEDEFCPPPHKQVKEETQKRGKSHLGECRIPSYSIWSGFLEGGKWVKQTHRHKLFENIYLKSSNILSLNSASQSVC